MKRILFVISFLTIVLISHAQHQGTYIGASFGRLDIDNYTPRIYGGVELDLVFENNLGIHYTLLGGQNYFHMPLSPLAGFILGFGMINTEPISDSTDSKVGLGVLIGVITAIIPEAISYNIPLNDQMSIAPYISPLQLEYLKNKGAPEGNWYAGGGVGLKYHFYVNYGKFRFSPYLEYKVHYHKDLNKGFSYGVNLAMKVSKDK